MYYLFYLFINLSFVSLEECELSLEECELSQDLLTIKSSRAFLDHRETLHIIY